MPFQFRPYESQHAGSIGEIMARQGQARAHAVRQRGMARANTIGTLGQAGQHFVGNLGQIMQAQRDAPMIAQDRELAVREKQARIADLEEKAIAGRASREEAFEIQQAVQSAFSEANGDPAKAAEILRSRSFVKTAGEILSQLPKPQEPYTLAPGAQRRGPDNAVMAENPPAEKPPPSTIDAAIMDAYRSGNGAEVNRLLQLKRQTAEVGREGPAAEKPSVWVSNGGDMRFVTPTQAAELSQQGWRSGTSREQGRPVISGDANRIADFDTSMDDSVVLESVLTDTGTIARLGASAPTWVTEITGGWGEDAKSRNAVIARVKQVIGKALEGGVLRKEDEEKYKDILPTIGDTKNVAMSKIKGLNTAIEKRKGRLLDALEDAGYDVSRYRARSAGSNPVVVKVSDTESYTFPNQQKADEFKKAAGIP